MVGIKPDEYPKHCRDSFSAMWTHCIDDIYRLNSDGDVYKHWKDMHFPVIEVFLHSATFTGRTYWSICEQCGMQSNEPHREMCPFSICKGCGVPIGDGHVATCPVVPQPFDPPQRCPDDGTCHHGCAGACFRVLTCAPLSGVFPGDKWPSHISDWHKQLATPLVSPPAPGYEQEAPIWPLVPPPYPVPSVPQPFGPWSPPVPMPPPPAPPAACGNCRAPIPQRYPVDVPTAGLQGCLKCGAEPGQTHAYACPEVISSLPLPRAVGGYATCSKCGAPNGWPHQHTCPKAPHGPDERDADEAEQDGPDEEALSQLDLVTEQVRHHGRIGLRTVLLNAAYALGGLVAAGELAEQEVKDRLSQALRAGGAYPGTAEEKWIEQGLQDGMRAAEVNRNG